MKGISLKFSIALILERSPETGVLSDFLFISSSMIFLQYKFSHWDISLGIFLNYSFNLLMGIIESGF